jgi:hypothetical protein
VDAVVENEGPSEPASNTPGTKNSKKKKGVKEDPEMDEVDRALAELKAKWVSWSCDLDLY